MWATTGRLRATSKRTTGLTIHELIAPQNQVLLVDEGQDTYSDSELWGQLFKMTGPLTGPFTTIFASYGIAVSFPVRRHKPKRPLTLGKMQRLVVCIAGAAGCGGKGQVEEKADWTIASGRLDW